VDQVDSKWNRISSSKKVRTMVLCKTPREEKPAWTHVRKSSETEFELYYGAKPWIHMEKLTICA
jgi:hypothetical protein